MPGAFFPLCLTPRALSGGVFGVDSFHPVNSLSQSFILLSEDVQSAGVTHPVLLPQLPHRFQLSLHLGQYGRRVLSEMILLASLISGRPLSCRADLGPTVGAKMFLHGTGRLPQATVSPSCPSMMASNSLLFYRNTVSGGGPASTPTLKSVLSRIRVEYLGMK